MSDIERKGRRLMRRPLVCEQADSDYEAVISYTRRLEDFVRNLGCTCSDTYDNEEQSKLCARCCALYAVDTWSEFLEVYCPTFVRADEPAAGHS